MTVPEYMNAMVLESQKRHLTLTRIPVPEPGTGQVLIKVHACGICRTDLHIMDGDLDNPTLPLVPGHEIIGEIVRSGTDATSFSVGDRVGIPWLARTCGSCEYCLASRENLCDSPHFTGYTVNGGFAEYAVADERYCFPIPACFGDTEAAPLLCAGLIGFRSYRSISRKFSRIGIFGFGAAAHIITQVAIWEGKEVYAFTRPGDERSQDFARSLGARWASGTNDRPDTALDAGIIFAPAGELVPVGLSLLKKGGELVCGGIHMSDIPSFQYELLWGERSIRSVANLERKDGIDFIKIAERIPVRTRVTEFPLETANEAMTLLKRGEIDGAAVLRVK